MKNIKEQINKIQNQIEKIKEEGVEDSSGKQFYSLEEMMKAISEHIRCITPNNDEEINEFGDSLEDVMQEKSDFESEAEYLFSKQSEKIKELEMNLVDIVAEQFPEIDVLHNYKSHGTAWELLIEAIMFDNMEIADVAEEMIKVSKARHEETDYDNISKKGMSDEEVAQLRKDKNRKIG
jgi:uncharacterized phage infection (PIP) family protein YhgE